MPVSKQRKKKKSKPKTKPQPQAQERVTVVRRRFEYDPSTRKDDERLVALICEIGTRWEPLLSVTTWNAADKKDREFIRQYKLYFKQFHPGQDKLAEVASPPMEHINRFIKVFRTANPNYWI